MRWALVIGFILAFPSFPLAGQTRRQPPARSAQPAPKRAPADLMCPSVLGVGMSSQRTFCDVLIERNPERAIVVQIPPHRGTATLSFDLHNRHTYSEEEIRAGRGYALYTATVGVYAPDATPLGRGIIRNEFRTAGDLFDRVGGGAGPTGVKAVAPTGIERVLVSIPAALQQVLVVGEQLEVLRRDGREIFTSPGRPVAIISQVEVEYRPAPAPRGRR